MIFYIIILIVAVIDLVYEIVSFFKTERDSQNKNFYMDFIRRLLIDIFVWVFCLSKIFPDINWL